MLAVFLCLLRCPGNLLFSFFFWFVKFELRHVLRKQGQARNQSGEQYNNAFHNNDFFLTSPLAPLPWKEEYNRKYPTIRNQVELKAIHFTTAPQPDSVLRYQNYLAS